MKHQESMLVQRLRDVALALDKTAAERDTLFQQQTEPIAIVGIGCRFPGGANSPEAFWELLETGRDAVVPLDERWTLVDERPSEDVPRWAGLLTEPIDHFDPAFFGISPREANKMDPQHRLLLEVAWEALENAAIQPRLLNESRVGVFVGAWATDYAHILAREPRNEQDAYSLTGGMLSISAGRVSYTLGLQGPCLTVDTACSSSLVATHLACRSLRARGSDLALAGGVNLIISPRPMEIAAHTQALSSDGRCRAFDASANGMVRGEGCGLVVLKRLSDAQRDGDRIWALIRGSAVNQDGRSTSLTAPNMRAQEVLLREALQNARVDANTIGYVETHGTGTSLGDPIEVEALRSVLGAERPDGSRCVLGAVKTNIGHLESAAGIAGLIKATLVLQNERIPRNLNFRTLNPRIRLEGTALALASEPVSWPRTDRPRFAGVSSFGLSGTNAHLVLEEAPAPAEVPAAPTRQAELVVLSAKSAAALDMQAARLSAHLERHPELAFGDIAFSLATTRSPMEHRLAIAASSPDALRLALDAAAKGETPSGVARRSVSSSRGKLAFLFTGQGAQMPGMGRGLHAAFPAFRQAFDRCAALFDQELSRPLRDVMWAEAGSAEAALLDQTAFTQPALFTLEYALYALWQSWGITPDLVAGHSIGELVAACVAGVFSLENAVRLVAARGRLMQALPAGGAMVSIAATEADVAAAVAPHAAAVSIAAVNAPDQVVIAGVEGTVEAIAASFSARGVRTKRLAVSHAFHSPLLDPMQQAFERVAALVSYHRPTIGLVSNLSGTLCTDEVTQPAYWVRHLREAVRFADGVKALYEAGATTFIEVGPRSTLLGLITACLPNAELTLLSSLRPGREEPLAVLQVLGDLWGTGVTVDWKRLFPAGGQRVLLPTYSWQRERYWLQVSNIATARTGKAAGHPLLSVRVPTAGTRAVFEALLGLGSNPWLADYRIADQVDVGGAMQAELIRAGVALSAEGTSLQVTDLVLQAPLRLPEAGARRVQVVITETEGEAVRAAVYSQPAESETGADWTLHSTATGTYQDSISLPEPLDLAAAQARCTEAVDVSDLYAHFAERGLSYGFAFRALRSLWIGKGEALAEVALPAGMAETGYALHPALLDAALQAAVAVMTKESLSELLLPCEIGRFAVHQPGAETAWVHVTLHGEPDTSGMMADVVLVDPTGAVVAEIRDLGLQGPDRTTPRVLAVHDMKPAAAKPAFKPREGAAEAALAGPELRQRVLYRLRQLFSKLSQVPLDRIDAAEALENYGLDSFLITKLNSELGTVFAGLSKTLFFEYQNLDAIAGYLVQDHLQSCVNWTGTELDGRMQPHEPPDLRHLSQDHKAAAAALPLSAPAHPGTGIRGWKSRKNREATEPIAIIGMSGRYPRAVNLTEFWHNLQAGTDCIGEIPADRWPLNDFFVADRRAAVAQGKSYSKWGGFIDGFADFDPLFFHISPREARDIDPQERLFLQTCWATFENAGYTKAELEQRYQGRVGVFVGITKTGFELYGPELWRRGGTQMPQTLFSSVANRISYLLNLHGPSMAIDTMCSASMTAIHEACEHIYRDECDMAIAGGVNLYLHPSTYVRLCALQMLSPDGRCKTFAEGADGFVPGEGVGAILLKPLSLAQRDGDQIYAQILSTSINHDGKTNGYTVPNPVAQARLIRRALDRAGVNARQVSYIEAHGTGTKLGDPIEIRGLQQAFEQDTGDKQFCAIGSIKSNIGHLEAAAGIAGVTKVILQMRHRTLVPSLHSQTLNPNIDFANTPFVVQREPGEWQRPAVPHDGEPGEYPRIAGVSSFGAGGSNAHVLLAEYDDTPSVTDQRGESRANAPCAIVLSAHDRDRLRAMAGNLARYLREHHDTLSHRLHDIAYTLQLGREAMDERLAIMATSYAHAEEKLQRFANGEEHIEDLYYGQIKANKGILAAFNDDEDMAKTIELWLLKYKYNKLLELWVKGLQVDWRKLYEGKHPRRLSLPSYPFAGNTYWITVGQERPNAHAGSQPWLHPLVQRNTSSFAGQEFTSLLSGQEFFLSDHRVHGQKVLPGVAYLEMARAASALSGLGPITGLRNILWSTVLKVEDTKKVTISLSKIDNRVKYQIKTASSSTEDIHGQGSVISAPIAEYESNRQDAQTPEALALGEVKVRCPATIPVSDIYAYFHHLGLEYGIGFQALHEVQCSEHEVLAAYRLPASIAESFADFVLHPSIMDAALQALIAFELRTTSGNSQSAYTRLPFSVCAVDLLQQMAPEGYIYASRVDTGDRSESFTYDIRVLDRNGVSCVTMQQLTLRPLISDKQPPRIERRHNPSALDHLLFATPTWREQTRESALGESYQPNALVLFLGGSIDIAEQLASKLGSRVEVLGVDEQRRIDETAADLVKQAFEQIKAVFQDGDGANGAGSIRALYLLVPARLDQRIRAPLASLLATAHQENARLQGRLISLPDEYQASVDTLCSIVQRESGSDPSHIEVVYQRDGKRFVKQWSEVTLGNRAAAHADGSGSRAQQADRASALLKAGGVYWITGGMGGLGKLFAEHLLNLANVSIVLSGRSALADQQQHYLDTLKKPGRTIEYRQSDIGDQAQVQELVEYIQRQYGALHGIIHSAGVLRDGLIVGKSASDFEQVFTAKVRGVEYIDSATRSMSLDFFLLCSSLAAVTGNPGQADYSSANAYLDAFAHTRNAMALAGERQGITLSVNWPLWKEGGMRVDARAETRFFRRTGISSLATRDGLVALDAMLAARLSGQVLVVSGDKEKIRASLSISIPSPGNDVPAAPEVTDAIVVQTSAIEESAIEESAIEEQLIALCADLLQIEQRELDVDSDFSEYGVDSIQMMHMLNRLESMYEITLDPSAIANHSTIRRLAQYLRDEGVGAQRKAPEVAKQANLPKPPTVPATETPTATTAVIEEQLIALCADLLQIEQRELDVDSDFSEYGVDSIQMMHMLNRLESMYEITLDPSAIANHSTIRRLARYLLDEGAGKRQAARKTSQGADSRDAAGHSSAHGALSDIPERQPAAIRRQPVSSASRTQQGKIAIIGQACRFPQSPDIEAFWHNLACGNNLITEVPRDRWDIDSVYSLDRSARDKTYSRYGGFLDDIAEFDAEFFGISDIEAIGMDPQHRIILELARELFESSGYSREALDGSRTSVLLGAKDNNYVRNYYGYFPPASLRYTIANTIANMMAARVSDFYNLKGAAKTIDTACSSALVAVHDACRSILTGEADMAVAGGISLLVDPFYHIGFSRAEILSEDDRTCVFDEKAKGFALSEGAGLVLLKEYEAAVRDNDSILGVILASAVNNDGHTMRVTVPSQEGQQAVIEQALQRSGITPDSIGYYEAHGTGTLLGDAIEIKAATEAYRKYTTATQYCAVGSTKSNMGHSLTAAGIASLLKVLLSLQHRQIPATIHCSKPHPRFRFETSPFYPNTRLREWNPIGERRIAAITALGFGGTNCHMIVAEP